MMRQPLPFLLSFEPLTIHHCTLYYYYYILL